MPVDKISPDILVPYCCCNKLPHTLWLKPTHLFSYCSRGQNSEIRFAGLKSTCCQGWFFLEALRRESTSLLFSSSRACLQSLAPASFLHFQITSLFLSSYCFFLSDLLLPSYNNPCEPWLVWLSWLEHHPVTKRSQVRFPVRAHAQVAGLIPSLGTYLRQPICFSHQ